MILQVSPEFNKEGTGAKTVHDSVLGFVLRTYLLLKRKVENTESDLSGRIYNLEFTFDERGNSVEITVIVTILISNVTESHGTKSHVAALQCMYVDTADNLAEGLANDIVAKVRGSIRSYPPILRLVTGVSTARPS